MKTIKATARTPMESHREDFETCPDCGHKMVYDDWDEHAVMLVLEPTASKSNSVAVFSECPKCFEKSWVHQRLDSFGFALYEDKWPKSWNRAVEKHRAAVKLKALRDWTTGLCGRCRHLESGEAEYHAWRVCIKGCGPVETECDRFKEVTR